MATSDTIRTGGAPRLDVAGLPQAPAWTLDAVCAQVDPEIFFPKKSGSTREAKSVCARCTVRAECLEYAMSYEAGDLHNYPAGIYGGLSVPERKRLRRELAVTQEAS